jgi:hypothetical protein
MLDDPKKCPNWTVQGKHGGERVQQERVRRALRKLPIFVVATIPFGLITFAAFDALSATLLVVVDVIFVTLAIQQAD